MGLFYGELVSSEVSTIGVGRVYAGHTGFGPKGSGGENNKGEKGWEIRGSRGIYGYGMSGVADFGRLELVG